MRPNTFLHCIYRFFSCVSLSAFIKLCNLCCIFCRLFCEQFFCNMEPCSPVNIIYFPFLSIFSSHAFSPLLLFIFLSFHPVFSVIIFLFICSHICLYVYVVSQNEYILTWKWNKPLKCKRFLFSITGENLINTKVSYSKSTSGECTMYVSLYVCEGVCV